MIGEFAFIISFIISIIFIFSKKPFWGWSLIILGAVVLITSFKSVPTLIAGILFILLGIYGTQQFKFPVLKDTKLIRGCMFFLFLLVVGGSTIVVNKIDQQRRDTKIEKSIKKELSNLKPEDSTSEYETIWSQIYTIDGSKIRQGLLKTYNSKKEEHDAYSSTSDTSKKNSSSSSNSVKTTTHTISGNANSVIAVLLKEKPAASKYIKSINDNSEYGLKVSTQNFKMKSSADVQKTVGNLETIMKTIRTIDTTSGIGFIGKENSGDTLFAIYFKPSIVNENTQVGTSDFFNNSTSYYVDGSVAGNNEVFTNKQLSKEGPTVNGKTYVNMLMND